VSVCLSLPCIPNLIKLPPLAGWWEVVLSWFLNFPAKTISLHAFYADQNSLPLSNKNFAPSVLGFGQNFNFVYFSQRCSISQKCADISSENAENFAMTLGKICVIMFQILGGNAEVIGSKKFKIFCGRTCLTNLLNGTFSKIQNTKLSKCYNRGIPNNKILRQCLYFRKNL